AADNAAPNKAATNLTDNASPIVVAVESIDSNTDGNVDAIEIQFSENVVDADFDAAAIADWLVSDDNFVTTDVISAFSSTVTTIASDADANDQYVRLSFTPSAVTGTGVIKYNYTYNSTDSINDGASNDLASITSTAATDSAAPQISTMVYQDSNTNGDVDRITVTYSENVTLDEYDAADWIFVNGTVDNLNVTEESAAVVANGNTIRLTVNWLDNVTGETGTEPTLQYVQAGGTANSVHDAADNAAPNKAATNLTDNASPIVVAVESIDSNTDGNVDAIEIQFSENV
ncbi:MAG: hypothetical protein GY841_01960, partial [FCB group bacterium]|nr:hypothetical protein [FCB group bacterium]